MKSGKVTLTREKYEKAKRLVVRWERKVVDAQCLIKEWERHEQKNRKTIGNSELIAITLENNGKIRLVVEGERGVESVETNPGRAASSIE